MGKTRKDAPEEKKQSIKNGNDANKYACGGKLKKKKK